jgi:hypothetical protein
LCKSSFSCFITELKFGLITSSKNMKLIEQSLFFKIKPNFDYDINLSI